MSSAALQLPHGSIQLPEFLPDATRGVVRSLDSTDLESCGVQALVMNTYHLMRDPGSTTIEALGGLHRMAGWSRPVVTDSGGFQIYSLIRQSPRSGSLTNRGAVFHPPGSKRKHVLTPEKSIQLQLAWGTDVVICLDDCTRVDDPIHVQRESVQRTVDWARRSKLEFTRLLEQRRMSEVQRPSLIAVIQGGGSPELRQECAEGLLETGFDGYGYGGWPLDKEGKLLEDLLCHTRQLIPDGYPLHALGVASPEGVRRCCEMGYDLFDGAMPTRDARHARLYAFNADPQQALLPSEGWYNYVYILDERYIKSGEPLSPYCDCLACRRYTAGYLHHLFKIQDGLAYRLATLHNLRFMTLLTQNLRMSHTDATS
jgi:queuine tRNA-ribosyltransferase